MRGPKSLRVKASQATYGDMRQGAEVSVDAVSLRELWRSSHTHTCCESVFQKMCWSFWTVEMSQRFIWSLTEELMLACESSCQRHTSPKGLQKKKNKV